MFVFDIYQLCLYAVKSIGTEMCIRDSAKMARGEMVRFMAENDIENPDDIKKFERVQTGIRRRNIL